MIQYVKQVFFPKPEADDNQPNSKNNHIFNQQAFNFVTWLFMFLLFVFVIFMVQKVIRQAPDAKVTINNDNLTTAQYQQLKQVSSLNNVGNFFSADLTEIKNQLTTFSWVDKVTIDRTWHQGIIIDVLARQPIAKFGTEKLLDSQGQVYYPADDLKAIGYPLVNLQGDPKQSETIMRQMQQVNEWYEPLGLSVEDMILTPRMTWLIRFDSGLRLLVDGENTAQKLLNVSEVLQTQLAGQKDQIELIDLRYKNGFAISWKSPSS